MQCVKRLCGVSYDRPPPSCRQAISISSVKPYVYASARWRGAPVEDALGLADLEVAREVAEVDGVGEAGQAGHLISQGLGSVVDGRLLRARGRLLHTDSCIGCQGTERRMSG